jgi:hypothetical protein
MDNENLGELSTKTALIENSSLSLSKLVVKDQKRFYSKWKITRKIKLAS